jgi:hypothetical protein
LAGKRRAGKTILLNNILLNLTNRYEYSNIVLISDTAEVMNNENYNNIIDKNMMFGSE